jgi:hypothetical protein
MTTQITFTTDENLKNATLKKAKQNGITLKAFLIFCMEKYLQGKLDFDMATSSEYKIKKLKATSEIQDKIDQIDFALELEEDDKVKNYTKIKNFNHLKKMLNV